MPSAPFWGLLGLLYAVLAAVAGVEAATLAAVISIGWCMVIVLAAYITGGQRRRHRRTVPAATPGR